MAVLLNVDQTHVGVFNTFWFAVCLRFELITVYRLLLSFSYLELFLQDLICSYLFTLVFDWLIDVCTVLIGSRLLLLESDWCVAVSIGN